MHTLPRAKAALGFVVGFAALLLTSCATIDPPPDYARVRDVHTFTVKAVSPAGNVITLSSHPNDDANAGLQFWSDAVEQQKVAHDGMKLVDREAIRARNGLDGTLFRFEAGEGRDRLVYLVAVYVTPMTIHVVEAAGTADRVEPDLDKLKAAVQSLH